MSPSPNKQFDRLEILCSAVAVCLAVGSVWGLWPFDLPIALVLLAVLYGVLRDVRSLNRVNRQMTAHHRSRSVHGKQTDGASR